jgi:hypothetical protein
MRLSVPALADTLQSLFSTHAQLLARSTGLIQRQRQLTAAQLARVLVFGWAQRPDASLEELADDLTISPQALHLRLNNPKAPDFFAGLLQRALSHALNATHRQSQLLARFHAVYIEDCTYLSLPLELNNNSARSGTAGVKLFIRWNVAGGQLAELALHPDHTSDHLTRAAAAPLPSGVLRLADGGFYSAAAFDADTRAGVRWVTRVPANLSIRPAQRPRQSLAAFLGRARQSFLDIDVVAGSRQPVEGRLLAWRVPAAVRRVRVTRLRRRCSKLGRTPSGVQIRMCGWTVLLTNLPREEFTPEEVQVLARVRWQVELLIKRFKSLGGVNRSRGRLACRVLCELYAKLLGCVVVMWGELLGGAPLAGAGCWRRAKRVRRRAEVLCRALPNPRRLRRELKALRRRLQRLRPTRRRTKPTTQQLLEHPALIT